MTDFMFRVIKKDLRRGFDREPSRGRTTGVCMVQNSVSSPAVSFQVSFYYGFAVAWKCLLQNSSDIKARKRLKAVESLVGVIEKYSYEDPQYEKHQEDMERIRAKFRQVCSVLNVSTDFKEYVNGSTDMSF
nr:protein LTO1 homolog isoform X2 [Misgurnus anguillicaudatus]